MPEGAYVAGPGGLPPARPDAGLTVDLSVPTHIHVIGIGGTGMTPIATVLVAMGHEVSGSERARSANVDRLLALGADVRIGHEPGHLDGARLVVASSAIPPDNPELLEAQRRGLTVLWRSEALAAICRTRRTLAVAGTKGKTTTSAMLASVLEAAGWRPSFVIGGDVHGLGHGAMWRPDGEWLVVEADESDGTFLLLPPEGVVVTNVLPDHLEFHGGIDGLRRAFAAFVALAPGPHVLCADDPGAAGLTGSDHDVTFGSGPGASVRMTGIVTARRGVSFDVEVGGAGVGRVELGVPGVHNARNACGALAMAVALGIDIDVVITALAAFREVARRFEWRGERDGVTFVDDYAHLPSAVEAVLSAARDGEWGRIVAVFQPHRYSRTEAIHADFADSFVDADVVVVTDVYASGEAPRAGVTGALVADAVRAAHPDADVRYVPSRADLGRVLAGILAPGDLCLTLGAGDLHVLAGELVDGTAGR